MSPGPKCRFRREIGECGGVGKVVRGKHWQFPVIVTGAMTGDAVWAIIKPAFLANGWTAVHEWAAGGIEMLLHYQKDGVEAWAETDTQRHGTRRSGHG